MLEVTNLRALYFRQQ